MARTITYFVCLLAMALSVTGCSLPPMGGTPKTMTVTAYCGCGKCNSYATGSWLFLKLDRWNKYVVAGPDKGRRYTGKTSSGTYPRSPSPGLLSPDTVTHPLSIPKRILPWNILPHDGTLAADTNHYPFGTRIYVPGYGWGRVEDRGGDIKGPERLDAFMDRHAQTLDWGRKRLDVRIFGR